RGAGLSIPTPPASKNAVSISELMMETYQQDLTAFHDECERWLDFDGPLVQVGPPAPWSAYRSLQGSAFPEAQSDPNPFRPALEVVRSLETELIGQWLMSGAAH